VIHVCNNVQHWHIKLSTSKQWAMSEQKYFTSNSKLEVDLYNQSTIELIQEIGRRITAVTEDARETVFLFQHLSIALQRWNTVAFLATFDAVWYPVVVVQSINQSINHICLVFFVLHSVLFLSQINLIWINLYRAIVQRRVLHRVRLCRIKEKCLKTDLKCVNEWSSSTVQWKRACSDSKNCCFCLV